MKISAKRSSRNTWATSFANCAAARAAPFARRRRVEARRCRLSDQEKRQGRPAQTQVGALSATADRRNFYFRQPRLRLARLVHVRRSSRAHRSRAADPLHVLHAQRTDRAQSRQRRAHDFSQRAACTFTPTCIITARPEPSILHLREIFPETMKVLFPGNPLEHMDDYLYLTDWSLLEEVSRWRRQNGDLRGLGKEWESRASSRGQMENGVRSHAFVQRAAATASR